MRSICAFFPHQASVTRASSTIVVGGPAPCSGAGDHTVGSASPTAQDTKPTVVLFRTPVPGQFLTCSGDLPCVSPRPVFCSACFSVDLPSVFLTSRRELWSGATGGSPPGSYGSTHSMALIADASLGPGPVASAGCHPGGSSFWQGWVGGSCRRLCQAPLYLPWLEASVQGASCPVPLTWESPFWAGFAVHPPSVMMT